MKYLLSVFLFFLPAISFAQGLVQCGGVGQAPCVACDLIKLGSNIIEFIIMLATGVAVILIMIAGYQMVLSRGDVGAVKKAKGIFTNIVVGYIIMLAAWLIVDTFMKVFTGDTIGVWNEIQCVAQPGYSNSLNPLTYTPEVIPPPSGAPGVPATPGSPTSPTTPAPTTGTGGTFQLAGIDSRQSGHMSSALASFKSCVAGKLETGTYYITSISDDKIAKGTYTFEYCSANGQGGGCAHTRGSCHYGGSGSCVGASYALDIRTSNLTASQQSSVLAAATSCGGKGQHEGNHLHISKGGSCCGM